MCNCWAVLARDGGKGRHLDQNPGLVRSGFWLGKGNPPSRFECWPDSSVIQGRTGESLDPDCLVCFQFVQCWCHGQCYPSRFSPGDLNDVIQGVNIEVSLSLVSLEARDGLGSKTKVGLWACQTMSSTPPLLGASSTSFSKPKAEKTQM